jgi:hypothetical protein
MHVEQVLRATHSYASADEPTHVDLFVSQLMLNKRLINLPLRWSYLQSRN